MESEVTAAEAKARFSECLRAAEGGHPVTITRYGKAVAAIVAAQDLANLLRLQAAGPQAGLAGLAGRFDDMDEFVDAVQADAAHRRPTRSDPSPG